MTERQWQVLEVLRQHRYEYRLKGAKPDDPGWHECTCGWEGYWCEFEPHLADRIVDAVDS